MDTMPTPTTRAEAEQYVATVISGPSHETDPADFNVEGIADTLYIINRSWDLTQISEADFWEAVQMHDRSEDADR